VIAADIVWQEGAGRRARRWLMAVGVVLAAQAAALLGRHIAAWLAHGARPAPTYAATAPGGRLVGGAGLPTPLILGYYDGGGVDSSGWFDMVEHTGTLNGIVPDWFTIWSDGQITGTADPGVMAYAQAHGLWTFALVQQNSDPAVWKPLLTNPTDSSAARENLLRLVEQDGFDGVNLDFEGIAPAQRNAFTRFVQELSALFHANGYYVTLSVPGETADEPTNSWSGAYNYRALGQAADLVMLMAYDDHYAGGPPGGVAPEAWVAEVARYAVSVIPPSRVVLGVPGYGYDWGGSTEAAPLSYGQAVVLDDRYAGGLAGNHFAYTADGIVHEVYFDDAETFAGEAQVALDYNLRGVAVWRLGIEDPAIWQVVQP
jgi:spore germination protein